MKLHEAANPVKSGKLYSIINLNDDSEPQYVLSNSSQEILNKYDNNNVIIGKVITDNYGNLYIDAINKK